MAAMPGLQAGAVALAIRDNIGIIYLLEF